MTTRLKIIVDTNVIVAASIVENIRELNIQVAHRFYEQSIQLFSIFKKLPNEKIGICIPKVKSEAFSVLATAVKDTFVPPHFDNIRLKKIFFDNAVAFTNSSDHKMRYLISLLFHLNPEKKEVEKNHKQVKAMSFYLKDLWKFKYRGWDTRNLESEQRSENIRTEKYWEEDQKGEVFSTHRGQVSIEAAQLEKFMRKWPNKNDEQILAETITVKQNYERSGENFKFYIASCDTGFFSPLIYRRTLSNIVSSEIKDRFGITCNIPKVIFWDVTRQIRL